MPRQRSKKLDASRSKEEKPAPKAEHQDQDSGSDIESDDGSLQSLEKDEEEEDLDRLVFGDDAGFKAMLGQSMDVDSDNSNEEIEEAEDGADAGGLEDVDDAEVRTLLRNLTTANDMSSSSSLIRDHPMGTQSCSTKPPRRKEGMRQHGRTATTRGWLYHLLATLDCGSFG